MLWLKSFRLNLVMYTRSFEGKLAGAGDRCEAVVLVLGLWKGLDSS